MLVLNELNHAKFGDGHDFAERSLTLKVAQWADTAHAFLGLPEGDRAWRKLRRLNVFSRIWLLVSIVGLIALIGGWKP